MTTDLDADAPHSPERTKEAANLGAGAIRFLNHATISYNAKDALEYPADLDTVISSLATMTQRLPQLVTQLGDWLTAEADAGHLDVVSGQYERDPVQAADVVRLYLDTAMARFGDAHKALDSARQVTSAIARAGDDEEQTDG